MTTKILIGVFAALSMAACAPTSNTNSTLGDSEINYNDGEERLPDDPSDEVMPENPNDETADELAAKFTTPNYTSSQKAQILSQYDHLDPKNMIHTGLLEKAVLYYHANKANLKVKSVMTVIDFSQSSKNSRFFIISMNTGTVVPSRTAHGKNSDTNFDGYAESFSNVNGSKQSSIGPYLTAETYQGSKGYSLRLDGLASTNSRARTRAIVVHAASYVQDRSVIQGRSWGCPALPTATNRTIINTIKGGSLMYAGLSKSLSSTP